MNILGKLGIGLFLVWVVMLGVVVVGWISNIVILLTDGPFGDVEVVLRIVGIPIFIIGAALGYYTF